MRRHPIYFLALLLVIFSFTFLLSCGATAPKTPKYPGAEAPIGNKQTPPPKGEDEKVEGVNENSGYLTPPTGGDKGSPQSPDSGMSTDPVVPPQGSAGLAASDTDKGEEPAEGEETASDEETKTDETAASEETAADESSEGETSGDQEEKSYRDQTPSKYYKDLGPFAFYYNDKGTGPVGELNELLEAINLLTVNQEKYEHARDFLSTELKDMSRGDPLFIPDAVPEELRPLIPGEGIEGSIDEALYDLFTSQVEANLRIIPIHIVGVMEYGGSKMAIGTMAGRKFQVAQGDTRYMGYGGWLALGVTGTYVSEDLVILSLALYSYSGYGLERVTDMVPRSFHIGIT